MSKYLLFHIVFYFLLTAGAKSTPTSLVYWNENSGIQRLSESQYKTDFFKLANNYRAQPNGVVCGPTTASIVLNALRLDKHDRRLPKIPLQGNLKSHLPEKWDPEIKMYTPENFISPITDKVKTREQIFGQPIKGQKDFGLQLRQLHQMLLAHGVKSKLRVVSADFKLAQMRQEMLNNLKTANDYVIVNYKRSLIGQEGGGHISPIGAYHKASDSFLIMDVTASKHAWVWVPTEVLFQSLQSLDMSENRGYLLVSEK